MHEPTVFVVDDDELARASVCALVQSMGIDTESFCSAEEFLESYTDRRPGCLVTDVQMHGMSGIELLERLQELDIPLPVVAMTAYAQVRLTVRVMQAGAVTLLENRSQRTNSGMRSARPWPKMSCGAIAMCGVGNSNVASTA